jgi:hypothetical protein
MTNETMAQELVEADELKHLMDDFYEDLGGHIIHMEDVPAYFQHYIKHLRPDEREEVLARLQRESGN